MIDHMILLDKSTPFGIRDGHGCHWSPSEWYSEVYGPTKKRPEPTQEKKPTESVEQNLTPLQTQVGGNHYKNFKIQPAEFCHQNQIPYMEGNVIKYVCRWRQKNGLDDLKKAKHYLDLIIEMEENK